MAGPRSLWVFGGSWRLERQIEDRLEGGTGRLTGEAVFQRSGQTLVYDESGSLMLSGMQVPLFATRRYLWRREKGWIAVAFEDGRPFHAFPCGIDAPEASHHCAPDHYKVTYDFRNWPDWSATWWVSGPRKDYTMRSRYLKDV